MNMAIGKVNVAVNASMFSKLIEIIFVNRMLEIMVCICQVGMKNASNTIRRKMAFW